jgi:hypothetical protein
MWIFGKGVDFVEVVNGREERIESAEKAVLKT